MQKNQLVAPVLKWVGGKRQLLDALVPLLPEKITTYCEPFAGGAAMLFHLQPKIAYVNDVNIDLMQVYYTIRDNVNELIDILAQYKNDQDFYYYIRDLDRDPEKYATLSETEKAARIIYLNKTCFNGLYRVNSSGEFNSPFGYYKNPSIVNAPILRAVNAYFNKNSIFLTSGDYSEVLQKLPRGSFVYLDPPYDPVSTTSNFTGYTRGGFSKEEQIRLRKCCDSLTDRGIRFMLSNSATDFIKEQYASYDITIVQAKRAINPNPTKRGNINEVVVRNYE